MNVVSDFFRDEDDRFRFYDSLKELASRRFEREGLEYEAVLYECEFTENHLGIVGYCWRIIDGRRYSAVSIDADDYYCFVDTELTYDELLSEMIEDAVLD